MTIYSNATVGDGLMSQIPALLISVATGMIVTRSASESNLNEDVSKQFTSQPKVLIIAGAVMLCLIFIGFPALQIVAMSSLLIGTGVIILRKEKKPELATATGGAAPVEEVASEASYYKNIENVYGLLHLSLIHIFPASALEEMMGDFVSKYTRMLKRTTDENKELVRKQLIQNALDRSPLELKAVLQEVQLDTLDPCLLYTSRCV